MIAGDQTPGRTRPLSARNSAVSCLVVGGSGFIGSRLVAALAESGYAVRSFDRLDPRPEIARLSRVEFMQGTIENEEELRRAVAGCDICFHLASTTTPKSSNDDPAFDLTSNVVATLRLLDACRDARMAKLVFLSSGGTVYGRALSSPIPESHPTDPLCAYGIGRLSIEKYLALYRWLHGLDCCILRAANAYGPGQRTGTGQGAIAAFLGRILDRQTIEIWGDGSVIRDFVHVDDLAQALVASIRYRGGAHVFNVGSGQGCSLNELLGELSTTTGRPLSVSYLPGRPFDVPVNVLDISLARDALAWTPKIGLPEGLRRTWTWLLDQSAAGAGMPR